MKKEYGKNILLKFMSQDMQTKLDQINRDESLQVVVFEQRVQLFKKKMKIVIFLGVLLTFFGIFLASIPPGPISELDTIVHKGNGNGNAKVGLGIIFSTWFFIVAYYKYAKPLQPKPSFKELIMKDMEQHKKRGGL